MLGQEIRVNELGAPQPGAFRLAINKLQQFCASKQAAINPPVLMTLFIRINDDAGRDYSHADATKRYTSDE